MTTTTTTTSTFTTTTVRRAVSLVVALLAAAALTTKDAFADALVVPRAFGRRRRAATTSRSSSSSLSSVDDDVIERLRLTPELDGMVRGFARISDEKVRYKNLVYLANGLEPVGDDVRTPENKVPGCLSTVHVVCDPTDDDGDGDRVRFRGDSDGILTKGLLAMLVRGLSGCTPEQIEAVDPEFVRVAGIAQTLTPGRNNGFLNMMDTMKRKAREVAERRENGGTVDAPKQEEETAAPEATGGSPLRDAITSALAATLKPERMEIVERGESEFELFLVAEVFDGVAKENREQLIRMLLGDLMPNVRRLDVDANSPSEAASS